MPFLNDRFNAACPGVEGIVLHGRGDAGQAMTEYAIVLALVAGLNSLQRLTQTILAQPPATLLIGGAIGVVVVCAFAFSGRRS
jgi:hypothetical protein